MKLYWMNHWIQRPKDSDRRWLSFVFGVTGIFRMSLHIHFATPINKLKEQQS